jgi:hypothetical protein
MIQDAELRSDCDHHPDVSSLAFLLSSLSLASRARSFLWPTAERISCASSIAQYFAIAAQHLHNKDVICPLHKM